MSEKRITLYTTEDSLYLHRVTLALEEANLAYDTIIFEISNKLDWFTEKVYPAAIVPYLVYGGPKLQPGDSPSPDLPQLGESLIILEFLADTFPEAHLLPSDPFLCMKACLFYHAVDEKYSPAFTGFFFEQAPKKTLYDVVEHIQGLLPATGFTVGDWSIADAVFMPWYVRMLAVLELNHLISEFTPGTAAEVLAMLRKSPKFTQIWKYLEDNMVQPSAAKTWNPEPAKATAARHFEAVMAEAKKLEA